MQARSKPERVSVAFCRATPWRSLFPAWRAFSTGDFDVGTLLSTDLYNIPLVQFLLIVIVLFNALLSSLMIRTVDGGHKVNALVHFVVLAWISSVIAVLTRWLVGLFLNV